MSPRPQICMYRAIVACHLFKLPFPRICSTEHTEEHTSKLMEGIQIPQHPVSRLHHLQEVTHSDRGQVIAKYIALKHPLRVLVLFCTILLANSPPAQETRCTKSARTWNQRPTNHVTAYLTTCKHAGCMPLHKTNNHARSTQARIILMPAEKRVANKPHQTFMTWGYQVDQYSNAKLVLAVS
jgi:Rieske Fe-S protein